MRVYRIIFLLGVILLQSCQFILQDNISTDEKEVNKNTNTSVVKDKDENGCLSSAGYIWSELNKDCVKIYSGIQLNPYSNPENEDETKSAFLMFSEDGNKAEIFLPDSTKTLILTRQAEGKPWTKDNWQLVPFKGYVLKEGEEIKFSGDGELGKKVTGSDNEQ